MPKTKEANIFRLKDFTKGMTAKRPITNMPIEYSNLMQNCHITQVGTVAKVPGYEKSHSTPTPVPLHSGFEFVQKDGSDEIITAGGGNLYSFTPDTGMLAPLLIYEGMDINASVWFSTMNDLLIIVNGIDLPLQYDGVAVTPLDGDPPIGTHVYTHYNRCWMTDATDTMIVHYSALNDPNDWTTPNDAGFIDLSFVLNRGDKVLEISGYINHIVFFLRYHIIIYSGTDPTPEGDFYMMQNIKNVGVVATGSTYELENNLLFITDTGIRSLQEASVTGSLEIETISDEVESAMTKDISVAGSDVGIFHYPKNDWLLFLVGEKVWLYNYVYKAWGIIAGMQVSVGVRYQANRLFLLGDTGFIYEYGKGWDFGGKEVAMIWEGPFIFPKPNGTIQPKLAEIWAYGYEQEVSFKLRLDAKHIIQENRFIVSDYPAVNMDTNMQDYWNNVFIMDNADYDPIRIPLFGSGRVLQWSMTHTGNDGPIEFLQIALQANYGSL